MSHPTSGSDSTSNTASTASTPASFTTLPTATSPTAPPSSAASSRSDPLGFVFDLKSNPCFRSSLMWGIGLGSAMGVHSFTRYRLPYRASDTAVKTFFVVSAVSWIYCRYQARREKELFDAVYNQQFAAKQARKAAAVSGQTAAAQSTALADST